MSNNPFYLYTIIPQWGIFLGIGLVIFGYVEKKGKLSIAGWLTIVAAGLFALGVNLFGDLNPHPLPDGNMPADFQVMALGWQAGIAGVLALFSILLRQRKSKRYSILAILAVAYAIAVFFQYNHFIRNGGEKPAVIQEAPMKDTLK
jgi:uncharacterized membrane protein